MNQASLEPISAENIGSGEMLDDINRSLSQIIADVRNRPDIAKARTVSVTIGIEPRQTGRLDIPTMVVRYKIQCKVPARLGPGQTAMFQTDKETGEEALCVNVFIPGNDPDQLTILDTTQKEAK